MVGFVLGVLAAVALTQLAASLVKRIPKKSDFLVGLPILGMAFLLTLRKCGVSEDGIKMLLLVCVLYLVSVTDIYAHQIPNIVILTSIAIWILLTTDMGIIVLLKGLAEGLIVSFPLLILVLVMEKCFHKEALGGGDIKLLYVIGLYLGWEKTLLSLLLACVMGTFGGTLIQYHRKKKEFAMGPYIAVSAMVALLMGEQIIEWYLKIS